MSALLQRKLKEFLTERLASLVLAYPPLSKEDLEYLEDMAPETPVPTQGPPLVFIGDIPPKRLHKTSPSRDVPCVVIVPLSGQLAGESGAWEAEASIALVCCVYNNEEGDGEGSEGDLANLLSAITGALLPMAEGEPLAKRFILSPDAKGNLLRWVKELDQPKPFMQATMTSFWRFKSWE